MGSWAPFQRAGFFDSALKEELALSTPKWLLIQDSIFVGFYFTLTFQKLMVCVLTTLRFMRSFAIAYFCAFILLQNHSVKRQATAVKEQVYLEFHPFFTLFFCHNAPSLSYSLAIIVWDNVILCGIESFNFRYTCGGQTQMFATIL